MIYNDSRGGYIDNVPANVHAQEHRPRHPLRQLPGRQSRCRPGYAPVPSTTTRIAATSHQSGHLPGHSRRGAVQDQRRLERAAHAVVPEHGLARACSTRCPTASDGAPLQPLEVTLFNPSYDKDKFENTAWTVNGKFGDLKAVYTGGYLVRNVDQVGDYTNYARGVYADYYQCYGPGSD